MTVAEAQRLMDGHQLWNEHVENRDGDGTDQQVGSNPTRGDHDAFDDYATDVNSGAGGGQSSTPTAPHQS